MGGYQESRWEGNKARQKRHAATLPSRSDERRTGAKAPRSPVKARKAERWEIKYGGWKTTDIPSAGERLTICGLFRKR